MLNFSFQNTTKIQFGEDQIASLSKLSLIDAKVLVTYGGDSIKSNGVYDQVVAALAKHTWFKFSGIDHARTLSIVLPAVIKIRKEAKPAKLLQYAERVWNVTEGDVDSRIDRAIELTEQFFEMMQVPTCLSHVDLGAADIDLLIEKLTQHGMVKLGEHKAITPDISREILVTAL